MHVCVYIRWQRQKRKGKKAFRRSFCFSLSLSKSHKHKHCLLFCFSHFRSLSSLYVHASHILDLMSKINFIPSYFGVFFFGLSIANEYDCVWFTIRDVLRILFLLRYILWIWYAFCLCYAPHQQLSLYHKSDRMSSVGYCRQTFGDGRHAYALCVHVIHVPTVYKYRKVSIILIFSLKQTHEQMIIE